MSSSLPILWIAIFTLALILIVRPIWPFSPPDLIAARAKVWQRKKEFSFGFFIWLCMCLFNWIGTDRRKMARILAVSAKNLDKDGVGS